MGKKPSRLYLLPLWILGGVAVFKFYLLWYTYDIIRTRDYIPVKSISYSTLFWPFFLLLEMIIYWILRNRLQNRLWVNIHIWSACFALMIFPILYAFISMLIDQYNSPKIAAPFNSALYQIHYYLYWLLIGIGHIFFIATIVKSFSKKQATIVDEQAPGLFDEFAD